MTADDFRALALELPESEEREHVEHPDFRVGGKIFATLGPGEEWGMVKLTPDQQEDFVRKHPRAFAPVKGGWGLRGATQVILKSATKRPVRSALLAAWRNVASARILREHDSG